MKNWLKLLGLIAMAAVIGFTMTACGEGNDGDNSGGSTGKQAGSAVSTPTLNSMNSNSITVNAAAFTAGNSGSQTIEYGRNTTNSAPTSWQDATTFSGLNADTTYYVFARSKENTTHNAGTPSAGLPVTTDEENDPNRVSRPVTNTPAGIVPYGTEILLGTTTVGATIYYTTDGNDPTVFSSVFSNSSPIIINTPITIKAMATATGMTVSSVMTAVYTPTYTVTFNSNSGTSVSSILNVEHGSTITAPTPPTRTNHQFDGWYKNTGLTNVWNFSVDTVTANTTLYARWNVTAYIVTFNSNGGTPINSILVEQGSTITEPTPPTKAGVDYQFVGWYKNTGLTNVWDFATDTVTANTTLYAKWINPSLTYNLGDTGPGGGIIFYRSEVGFTVEGSTYSADTFSSYTAYYLEAAPSDLDGTYRWFYENYSSFFGEEGIGQGRQNTSYMASIGTTNTPWYPAARVCSEYSNNGQTDWFIPSIDELRQLYNNRAYVGNMGTQEYWSSSTRLLSSYHYAYYINFSGGGQSYVLYYSTTFYLIRPIRAF